MNSWMMALKKWNEKSGGKWEVPKKGTKGYMEVRKMQEQMKKMMVKKQK